MTRQTLPAGRQTVTTTSGEIAYLDHGEGPAALLIHGFPVNGRHWRHVVEAVADMRRCIAPDLMALGHTEIAQGQDVGFAAQATMLVEVLDALGVDRVDLVGNDSGGAIAQILATRIPARIRSLTLTNCDTEAAWPPQTLAPILDLARAGRLGQTFAAFIADPAFARSPAALGAVFEFPDRLTPELLEAYLGPLTASPKRMAEVDAYALAIEQGPPEGLTTALQALTAPTLVVWADADIFFPVATGGWLAETIPGTRKIEVFEGAKLFFPEERPADFVALLREHWSVAAGA